MSISDDDLEYALTDLALDDAYPVMAIFGMLNHYAPADWQSLDEVGRIALVRKTLLVLHQRGWLEIYLDETGEKRLLDGQVLQHVLSEPQTWTWKESGEGGLFYGVTEAGVQMQDRHLEKPDWW